MSLRIFILLFSILIAVLFAYSGSDKGLRAGLEASHAAYGGELTFIFQRQKDPSRIRPHADEVASFLQERLNLRVRAQVPSDYSASVQALVSRQADIAIVDSMAFLLARRDGQASILLAEERQDRNGHYRTSYDSILVARRDDSNITDLEDLAKKASDLKVVFTSPTSTSGYIMPIRLFVKNKMIKPGQNPREVFSGVSFGGSYTQALEQLLLGRADVAAVSAYTLEGNAASSYLSEEKRSQLKVVARSSDVPTHVVAARGGLSEDQKEKITAALLELSQERPELLADVYGTSRLVKVEEEAHVQASIEAINFAGLPIEGLVRR
jgi:phosphonate transport system substrate-binding protein